MFLYSFLVIIFIALRIYFTNGFPRRVSDSSSPTRLIHGHFENSEADGKFHADWEIDLNSETISFHIIAATTGFVGFGISRYGGMAGADIVIGGMANGTAYFSDRYGIGNTEPITDQQQDWTLLSAFENSTHTGLKFYRALNTTDKWQDVPITPSQSQLAIMWSFGATDRISYHFRNRGSSIVSFFDPRL